MITTLPEEPTQSAPFSPKRYSAAVVDEIERTARELLEVASEARRYGTFSDGNAMQVGLLGNRVGNLGGSAMAIADGDAKRGLNHWRPRPTEYPVMEPLTDHEGPVGAPLRWFGSKFRLLPHLIPLFPPHDMFFDVFGGGGCVSLAKASCRLEVFNDLDSEVYHFYRTLQDSRKALELFRMASLTEYGRELYEEIRDRRPPWDHPPADDVERAYRFFVVNRMSFGGYSAGSGNYPDTKRPSWSYSITLKRKDMAASVAVWQKGVESLCPVYDRLRKTQIESLDFRELYRRYGSMLPSQWAESLWYFDPPYVQGTRVRGGYRHEMSDVDHKDLVEILLKMQGMAVLSGYQTELYKPLEIAGWERKEYKTNVFCSSRGQKKSLRTECIWINPACIAALAGEEEAKKPVPAPKPQTLKLWTGEDDEEEAAA